MQKKVCFQVIFVKCTDILGWKLIIYLFYVVIFFLFDTGSILVRRRLVASKQSSLDANCVRLTYFLGWIWITLQNTTFASRHVLLLIAIRVFRRYIRGSLQNIGKKFIHSIQHNSPGWTMFMGKFLERWIFGIGHLQHQIPYLEWVTLTSVSPESLSTSDSLGYRQHQISPRSGVSQHRNPRGGGCQQQIPRYGCPPNQILWVGCRQH